MTTDPADLNALLAHCAAAHDDTPRLVLADWLDEHADFRGEFVRAAVAFDRTPPHDVERYRLGERLRALLDSPGFTGWLPAHPAFKWGWRRGLLTLIADTALLQKEGTEPVAGWLASDWIERVEFGGYTLSVPSWEGTFGLVRNTRELHFGEDNYGPKVLQRLRDWPHLRGLELSYFLEPWADLAALPHLRALKLDNPDWEMMPALHEARLPNLEVLNLDKEWNDDLPHWGVCFPKLRSLTLTHYNTYPDEQCERFAGCSQLRRLGIYQRYQPFTTAGIKALARMKELRSLALGPLPRGTIAGFAKLSKLEHLHVEGVSKPVRGLESLKQLRWLSLAGSTLASDLVGPALALPSLARLDLDFQACEDGAIASLAKAPALRIVTVRSRDRQPAVPELSQLAQVQYLRIGYPGLPEPELLSLQTALPACRVVNGLRWDEGGYDWS